MLFLLFLISSVDCYRTKIDNKYLKGNIKFQDDDWSHGEVEWEFTEKSYINKLFVFDESYYFITAYELGEHGRFFIKFDPSSQLLNTKPYLFVLFQMLCGKLFGWNEWSLRLPTILSFRCSRT